MFILATSATETLSAEFFLFFQKIWKPRKSNNLAIKKITDGYSFCVSINERPFPLGTLGRCVTVASH